MPEYQKLRSIVHEAVSRINGHFGTLTHVPIRHLDRQLDFPELCALYAVRAKRALHAGAHACLPLITPADFLEAQRSERGACFTRWHAQLPLILPAVLLLISFIRFRINKPGLEQGVSYGMCCSALVSSILVQ